MQTTGRFFAGRALLATALFLFAAAAPASEAWPRLVSLAPSLTEMVFDLGAGDRLVGVTDHCRYPPEALAIAKVGGYQSPNFEAILALRPDLVLTLDEHSPSHPALDALGLKYAIIDHRSLEGLLDSLTLLGDVCGLEERAAELRASLEDAFRAPPPQADREPPTMLVIFGRDYGQGGIANAYAIGADSLYEKLIDAVGCRNAYRGKLAYPVLSAEGIAVIDPDIIVETVYTAEMGTTLSPEELLRDWSGLANLRAVREGRVRYVGADYVYVPGMRMLLLKRDLAEAAADFATAADAP